MNNFIISAFGDEIDMDLDIQMNVLASHDIHHIEMRGVDGKNVANLTTDEAKKIKKKMDDNEFKVSCVGSPIGKVQIEDAFIKHMELFKNVLSIAKILDTKYIRIFSFYYPKENNPNDYKDEVISRLGEMTLLAEDVGVTLLHENEKEIFGDIPERCLDILEGVNSPNLQAIFDPANFIQCGIKTYPETFKNLKKYVKYMHIKDALLETGNVVPAGYGDGNIFEILSELQNDGFKGFLSLEPHLGYFEGLENFETQVDVVGIKKGGSESFAVASNALKKILKELV